MLPPFLQVELDDVDQVFGQIKALDVVIIYLQVQLQLVQSLVDLFVELLLSSVLVDLNPQDALLSEFLIV